MTSLHRILVPALAAALLAACSERENFIPETRGDNAFDNFGGVYHPYIYEPGKTTRTPAGYRPFYISHIGRHGSRYPVDANYLSYGLDPLGACREDSILTEDGLKALRGFEKLDSISDGVYGLLDRLGADEHRGIADRMYGNNRRVFHQKDRGRVFVQSTHRQRCLMSAWNFCTALQSDAPSLKMDMVAGERYYAIISNAETPQIGARNRIYNRYSDTFAQEHFVFDSLYARLFTDVEKARTHIKSDRTMLETMYTNGTVAKYLGISDIYDVLRPEEYEFGSRNYAGKMNCQHCRSAENGEFRVQFARPLLEDFVTRADEAVAGNDVAADLRFTHDTGMMPFFGLIGLEGYDRNYTYEEAVENWDATSLMCMATNLQAVFYGGRGGKVIVRLLLNERETSIPALGPGPFYDWSDLRAYLTAL